jgi:hypothetical protein
LASALKDLYRAASSLYTPQTPFSTNLWCIKEAKLTRDRMGHTVWIVVIGTRSRELEVFLRNYVSTLSTQSVDFYIESDYLSKYDAVRNWYYPESLCQQAGIAKWFFGGPDVPEPVSGNMHSFWTGVVPRNYRVIEVPNVKCPKYEASGGVCLVRETSGDGYSWEYLAKGPNWDRIQDGTTHWLTLVVRAVPNKWLERPITHLIGANNVALEKLAVEGPVIRKEGGPGKVRWARSSSGNVYILGRKYIGKIQDDVRWNFSPAYIGKASNAQLAGVLSGSRDEWYVGTHGDDWIAWCPICQRWHSGDWSNWDLHVSARLLLASYQGLYDCISERLSEVERKEFYALAYLAIRCPTLWLWGPGGQEHESVRRTLGHTRSGSGDFVMHNNNVNQAVLLYLLKKAHAILSARRTYPCRSKLWWPLVSSLAASEFGLVLKPSSQLTHPHGFVACRCIFTADNSYVPRPSVCSVVRNWVNPSYDPNEYPNNTPMWMYTRFRDVNKALAWSPVDASTVEALYNVARSAGISDPAGYETWTDADLSRIMQTIVGQYSTTAYLDS